MITFQELTLQDKEIITRCTLSAEHRNCDLSFSNLCSWRFLYNTRYALTDNFLVFKFWYDGKLAYMLPVGTGDINQLADKLITDARLEKQHFRMLGLPGEMKDRLEAASPGRYTFTAAPNHADYIYLRQDLATLQGKKYQSKRNHINAFRKEYPHARYEPVTRQNIADCLLLEDTWQQKHNHDIDQEGVDHEYRAIRYAFDHFEELGLTGGIIYLDHRPIAFTYGMPINKDTFGVHVEKADIDINGIYPTINYEFANHIPEQYTYINREEDLGLEGLRKAKQSYHPHILLDKYMARLTEEIHHH